MRPKFKVKLHRKSKEERRQQLALTMLFTAVIALFLIVTIALAFLVGYIFIQINLMSEVEVTTSPVHILILLSVNCFILGMILASTAGRLPIKPVNRFVAQMNRLSHGDFEARISFDGALGQSPPIKSISDSFNKMAEELQNTEMLRADFVGNFSHEFKTPIVSIAGFAKLLRRADLSDEQRDEYLAIIEKESLRLSAMATGVLNLTKYENQSILTDISKFNLSEQLRACVLALEGKWTDKQIEIDPDFGEYTIEGNEEMLRHVWLNLMDNAIKFSDGKEPVTIRITPKGDELAVSVANSGQTISPDAQKHIWNKFYQADESHATEGNGIGLALVKRVAELHGGNVAVMSENGKTVFSVSLPKEADV